MVGAGAGIGGNGGAGGSGNTVYNSSDKTDYRNSGVSGDKGEDAGNININNSLTIYAYGGAGASSLKSENTNSGCGRWRLSSCRNRSVAGAGGGGGCSCDGGGGYSGGGAETLSGTTVNGLGGEGKGFVGGSGYLSIGTDTKEYAEGSSQLYKNGCIGGQGGAANTNWESGGDGGIAGNGGTVRVSSEAIIYAYNGDRITNGDYDTVYYEYKSDGTVTTTVASVQTKKNGDEFIPLTIYAQSGTLRAVYKGNYHWGYDDTTTYSYLKTLLGSTLAITGDLTSSTVDNYCIRATTTCSTTGYTNPATGSTQGIGSGAGYIEISNGTYTIDSSMD